MEKSGQLLLWLGEAPLSPLQEFFTVLEASDVPEPLPGLQGEEFRSVVEDRQAGASW